MSSIITDDELLLAIKRIDDYIEQEYSTTEIEKWKTSSEIPNKEEPLFSESFVSSFESILNDYLKVRLIVCFNFRIIRL